MTLRLRVGRNGCIILPKAIRETVGIDEGDEVVVEIRDGILLKPVRRFDKEGLRRSLRDHLDKLKRVKDLVEPKPGELAATYLEEEFEN